MGELQQQQQQQQPTFSWTGAGQHEGSRIYYSSFNFAGEPYALGDCVYLLPEEEGAPPYIAKLMRAWEDTAAADAEKLIIEVRWYERRSAVPAALAAVLHEREVVASDLLDTNLVGCLDKRATVVRASSYEEACELMQSLLPQQGGHHQGEWHFCRGVLDSASQSFRTFQELGIGPLDDEFGAKFEPAPLLGGMSAAQLISQGFAGTTAQQYCNGQQQQQQQFCEDADMQDAGELDITAILNSSCGGKGSSGKGSGGGNNNRSRRAGAAARVAAAAAAAGSGAAGSNGIRGIPGKVCCECGATQTPQWREGPQGPKTLCNACGVRYQRSQSKAKSNKRQASERARNDRGSPMHARAPKQACLANRAAAAAANDASKAAADGTTAGHGHGTRSASKGGSSRLASQQQNGSGRQRGALQGHGGSSAGRIVQRQPQQQHLVQHGGAMHGAAGLGMYELHFYEDEGSPPGMHTHILEEDEEEDEQQVLLRDTLNRSATHEAADVLHSLSMPQQQQQQRLQQQLQRPQQQQQQQHGYSSFGIGSPSSSMLLVDQLQPDSMPLLSLNDSSLTGVGPDGVLMGGPDSLDPSLNPSSFTNPGLQTLQPHSLSPLPRRVSSAAAGGSRLGASGASAVCASPGRLIAAMVQGLKLPTPLSLNGSAAAAAAVSDAPAAAAAPIGLDLSTAAPSQQQQQGAASMVSSSMLRTQTRSQQLPIGLQEHQPLHHGLPGKGLMLPLPLIGSNGNIHGQPHSGAAAAAAGGGGVAGTDSTPASAAVSSCDASGTPGAVAAAAGPAGASSSMVPTTTTAAAANGGSGANGSSCPLLSQLRSLVFRASAFTPDVQGLSGLYPGPSSPRAMQHLVQQLEQLPESSRVQLQQVSATVEEQLSKAKAADAAVLAVTQVLAAKKQAAAEARQEVENAVVMLRSLLGQVSPAAAAAAAGTGCCSGNHKHTAACSPGACTTAGGTGCCAAVSSAVTACTAVAVGGDSGCCVVGSSRLGGNSPRVLVSQGLPHPTQGFDLSTGDASRLRSSPYNGPGGVDAAQGFAGEGSDADDLIRDPEEQQQQQVVGKAPAAAAAAGCAAQQQQLPVTADVKQESDGQQQQQQGVAGMVVIKQEQQQQQQQQLKQAVPQCTEDSAVDTAMPAPAAAHAAAEPATVAA